MPGRVTNVSRRHAAGAKSLTQSPKAEVQTFRALLDCIPDPVFVVSSQGEAIIYCNAAAARWHGGAEETLVGRPFRDICTDVADDSRENLLAKVRVHGQVFVDRDSLRI